MLVANLKPLICLCLLIFVNRHVIHFYKNPGFWVEKMFILHFRHFLNLFLFINCCWISQKRTLAFSLILLSLYFFLFLSFRWLYCSKWVIFTTSVRLKVRLTRNIFKKFQFFRSPVNYDPSAYYTSRNVSPPSPQNY